MSVPFCFSFSLCVSCFFCFIRIKAYSVSSRFLNTTALLCSSSCAAKSRVAVGCSLRTARSSSKAPLAVNSARYRSENSANRSGSWPNHLRSSLLGATDFNQRSICAFSLLIPRGHSRSTRNSITVGFFNRRVSTFDFHYLIPSLMLLGT